MDYNNVVEEKGPQIPEEMVIAPPARSSTADLEIVKEESPHGQEVKTGPTSSLSAPPRAVSAAEQAISERDEATKEGPLGSQEMLTGVPSPTAEAQFAAPATDDGNEKEEEQQGPWQMPIQETGPHLPQELAQ
ncbi:hypothetical protein GBAR_LOCUS26946 [Geodia barretti]|uniref:Uncharacterized protein n=1 Tax=Geodia barretti TaxID=519541 RepID=A0AA35TJV1_GEOBA|nr:hypothetical protein GBAR_LOCUS26946 [Geodia barretti]